MNIEHFAWHAAKSEDCGIVAGGLRFNLHWPTECCFVAPKFKSQNFNSVSLVQSLLYEKKRLA